jgi:hypothetical protein
MKLVSLTMLLKSVNLGGLKDRNRSRGPEFVCLIRQWTLQGEKALAPL